VFVLPPSSSSATYRARIFTPNAELPFAGHPSVGAAVTAVRRGLAEPGRLVQECGAGSLPIDVTDTGSATLTGGEPTLGPPLDPAPLLSLVGLTGDDLIPDAAPRLAGCGLEFTFLPVRHSALAHAWVDAATAEKLGVPQISVFSWDVSQRSAQARVFCPGVSVPEDPATGSAALGLGVWLVAAGWLPPDGLSPYTIRQGIEMHRPSLLECTVTASAGTASTATVSGHVVPVASGEIAVPPFIG
jgi:trans-2,3-dihydro-3-hydroxyanthranilate isomerase